MRDSSRGPRVRFGVFEIDPASGELLKRGRRVRLHHQPFQLLLALLERPGELVTRTELQERLWPGMFVEFENGINNAVSRLREALGDSADNPKFIETLPRRGYRFIAPLESLSPGVPASAVPLLSPGAAAVEAPASASARARVRPWLVGGVVVAVALFSVLAIIWSRGRRPPASSVAVLPFVTGEAAGSPDDYLAFGMTDALIGELSRVGALKVISQTSVMQYKDVRKTLPTIARELDAGTIVEGSVLHEGGQVRITVQLIDARTDTHLWTQTYRRDRATALSTQRELAREVAGLIRARLAPSDRSAPPPLQATNPQAYEAYLRGRYFMQRVDEATRVRARESFEQSIAADPNFAPAHVGLANYFVLTDLLPPSEAMPRAKASALRALALDGSSAAAHASLGFVHYFGDWDWAAAGRELARAVELDPSDASSRRWHALYLSSMGRHATAINEVQRAIELDPVSISSYDAAGAVWSNARQFDKVLEQARRIHDLSPDDPRGFAHAAMAYLQQGRFDEAIEAAQKGAERSGRAVAFLSILAVAEHRAGRTEQARQTLREIDDDAENEYVSDVFVAGAYLWLRGHEAALDRLERAYQRRDGYLVVAKVAPWLDPLRGDPRFQALLRRMNFPE
jgi:TolB-like protein/DNA-binding winged helix-turn-helix (wHTH) protein